MTGRNALSYIVLVCALSLGAFSLAYAQTSPPGGSSNKPAGEAKPGGNDKPGDAKPGDAKPKPGKGPLPSCKDPAAVEADIAATTEALRSVNEALERLKRVLKDDVAARDLAKAAYGDNSPRFDAAVAVIKADVDLGAKLDAELRRLEKRLADLDALKKACPPAKAGGADGRKPGEGPLPSCKDPAAVEADIEASTEARRANAEKLDRTKRVLELDIKAAKSAKDIYGADNPKAKAAANVVKKDEALIKEQTDTEDRLKKRLADLDDLKKSCPPEKTGTADEPKGGRPVEPRSDKHAGIPPCDDGSDQLAARIAKDEDALAEVQAQEATATGAALDALKVSEASFKDELAALNGLTACPSDYHAPEEDGGGPSVTIGIGIGVGGDDHHHGDHKPRGGHCDAAARRDDP